MQKTWVLAAESSRARIFSVDNRIAPLTEIEDITCFEGRAENQDLVSDRPGFSFDAGGYGRHAMGEIVDPRQQDVIDFAKRLSTRLEKARAKGEFESLVVVAAPEFLGVLRQHLSANTMKCVVKTVNKNLVQKSEKIIREHI